MPLSELVAGYREQIRQFLDHPSAGLLVVVAAPEAEAFAAKLLSSVESEPTSEEVFFAYSGPFVDPASYYQLAAEAVLENLSEHQAALKEQGIELPAILPLDSKYAPGRVAVEVIFADFAERVGRALRKSVCSRTVIVLRAEEGSDMAAFTVSTHLLGSLSSAEHLKYAVLLGPEQQSCAEVPAPQRLNVQRLPSSGLEAVRTFQSFLEGVSRRVLVITGPDSDKERALRALQGAQSVLRASTRTVQLSVGTGLLATVVGGAGEQLRRHAQTKGLDLGASVPQLEPVDEFAELCERYAHKAMVDDGTVVVVLDLAPLRSLAPETGRQLVVALNRAACSPRVRYVLLDDSHEGILPPLEEGPRKVARLPISVDSQSIEIGLKKKLADVTLPVPERITYLQALAALASTRKDHDRALALHDEALGLCEQDPSTQPQLALTVWLGIGNALYAACQWASAERAYAKALELALGAEFDPGTAQATLSLGNALLCRGKFAEAGTCYDTAAGWYEKLGNPIFACHAWTWLGESQRRQGDLAGAEATWNRTLERYRALGPDLRDPASEGSKQVLTRLARLHDQRRNQLGALRCRRELETLGLPEAIVPEQP